MYTPLYFILDISSWNPPPHHLISLLPSLCQDDLICSQYMRLPPPQAKDAIMERLLSFYVCSKLGLNATVKFSKSSSSSSHSFHTYKIRNSDFVLKTRCFQNNIVAILMISELLTIDCCTFLGNKNSICFTTKLKDTITQCLSSVDITDYSIIQGLTEHGELRDESFHLKCLHDVNVIKNGIVVIISGASCHQPVHEAKWVRLGLSEVLAVLKSR
ncbi:hypothetical protein RCL1_007065 [Eukaryota sp. TZLM3-RCL]